MIAVVSAIDTRLGAPVTRLADPVRITFTLPVDTVNAGPANEMVLAYWDPTRGIWIPLYTTRDADAVRDGQVEASLSANVSRLLNGSVEIRALRVPAVTQQLRGGLQLVTFTGGDGEPPEVAIARLGAQVESLFRLSPETQRWESYIVGAPAHVQTLVHLEHREGVFVKLGAAATAVRWTEPGFIAAATGRELVTAPPGWSTLGYVGPAGATPLALTGGNPGLVLYAWDAATQSWLTYSKNRPAFANTLRRVDPLQGLIITNDGATGVSLTIPEAP